MTDVDNDDLFGVFGCDREFLIGCKKHLYEQRRGGDRKQRKEEERKAEERESSGGGGEGGMERVMLQ